MCTSVARGTTRRSAPIREKLCAMPCHRAHPATKLAKPTPTRASQRRRETSHATFGGRRSVRPTGSAASDPVATSSPRAESSLVPEKNIPGLVYLHAQVRRAAELRIEELSEAAICDVDLLRARRRCKPQHGERLLPRHARPAVAGPLHGGAPPPGALLRPLRSPLLPRSAHDA